MNYPPPAGSPPGPSVPEYFTPPCCSEDAVDLGYRTFFRIEAESSFEQWLCVHLWVAREEAVQPLALRSLS